MEKHSKHHESYRLPEGYMDQNRLKLERLSVMSSDEGYRVPDGYMVARGLELKRSLAGTVVPLSVRLYRYSAIAAIVLAVLALSALWLLPTDVAGEALLADISTDDAAAYLDVYAELEPDLLTDLLTEDIIDEIYVPIDDGDIDLYLEEHIEHIDAVDFDISAM